jgi:pyridoxamine 5'-phosphate oxidase
MIKLDIIKDIPYKKFYYLYESALSMHQENIEACLISSYDKKLHEVNARVVNIKFINQDEWIFFSNYNSPKSLEFNTHNQISATFFWNKISSQVRLKAYIKKTAIEISDDHFSSRSLKKNALAISSKQSERISSYEDVISNYEKEIYTNKNLAQRPDYWGGFSFTPYYFEFWEGHESRVNKRDAYQINNGKWQHFILQP